MALYQVQITFKSGQSMIVEDVEEFEAGRKFIFVRMLNGGTHSFPRVQVDNINRRIDKSGKWQPVLMRQYKLKRKDKSSDTAEAV